MGSSLPLTLINTVLYFSYLSFNFSIIFFKPRNSLVIRQNQRFTLLIYHQGSNIDLTLFLLSDWESYPDSQSIR